MMTEDKPTGGIMEDKRLLPREVAEVTGFTLEYVKRHTDSVPETDPLHLSAIVQLGRDGRYLRRYRREDVDEWMDKHRT